MARRIEAIFMDSGNTLRNVIKDPVFQNKARQELIKIIGENRDPAGLLEKLDQHYLDYKKWAKETLIEPSEIELWTRWMLPDYPSEQITPVASQLTRLWIESRGVHVPRSDARQTVAELSSRGYIMGVLCNNPSTTEMQDWLEKHDMARYFKVVLPSGKFGRRKPDPSIYTEAARLAGIDPVKCAYVGDNPSRDIEGARTAGFSMAYILLEQQTLMKEPPRGKFRPDGIVSKLSDLLQFFPPVALL